MKKLLTLTLLLFSIFSKSQTIVYNITTVAGGPSNFGNGGQATAAELNTPQGIFVDANNNIYFSDGFNNEVRRIDAQTGIITRIAGTGYGSGTGNGIYGGDGGPALACTLNLPNGIALDSAGNIYVADTYSGRIRKIDVSGNINTVAGFGSGSTSNGVGFIALTPYPVGIDSVGPLATQRLISAQSIAVDNQGNLYILSGSVIKVDKTTNVATVLAKGTYGSGATGTGGLAINANVTPGYGCLDKYNNIYITDLYNSIIRRIDHATGIITQLPGTFNELEGITIDTVGNIYILDQCAVKRIDAITNAITNVATAGPCGQSNQPLPSGIATDKQGNVYVAHNNRILKLSPVIDTTTHTTYYNLLFVAGTGNANYSADSTALHTEINNPRCAISDAAGNMYLADSQNNLIRKVDAATGKMITIAGTGAGNFMYNGDNILATTANLGNPFGLALDLTETHLYISDYLNNRVRILDLSSGIISTYAGSSSTSGFSGDNGPATSAKMGAPGPLAIDSVGNLYISDMGNFRIRKVDAASGVITTIAGISSYDASGNLGQATSAAIGVCNGIAIYKNTMYISDQQNSLVRQVSLSTGIISAFAGKYQTFDFSGDGGPAAGSVLFFPMGLAVDSFGNVFITDEANDRIRKVTIATGKINTVVGPGYTGTSWGGYYGEGILATNAMIQDYAYGVSYDKHGRLLIADTRNNRIRKLTPCEQPNAPVNTTSNLRYCMGHGATLSATGVGILGWYSAATGGTYLGGGNTCLTPPINSYSTATFYVQDSTSAAGPRTAITVSLTPLPSVGNSQSMTCANAQNILTVAGLSTYTWTPNAASATTVSVSVNPTITTTYAVTGQTLSCVYTATTTAYVQPAPVITGNTNICLGSYTNLTASGADLYTWQPTGSSHATISVAPTTTTTYTLSGYSYVAYCTATTTVTINVLPSPTIAVTATKNILCANNADTLIASGASTYTWSANNTVNDSMFITPTQTSTYTVTGTNASGCNSTNTITINVNPLPTLTTTSGTICAGQSYTLNASGANTYTYSSGSEIVTPSIQTIYTISGTDNNGCVSNVNDTVSVNDIPVITAVPNYTYCSGDSTAPVIFTTTPVGSVVTYSFSPQGGVAIVQTGNIPSYPTYNPTPLLIDYPVTAYATNNGCVGLNTAFTISINPVSTVSFSIMQDAIPHVWEAYPTYSSNTQTAIWYWGDGDSTVAMYPSHTYTVAAHYNVCVKAINMVGCWAIYCINDSLYRMSNSNAIQINTAQQTTGFADYTQQQNVSIYPNPTADIFVVEVFTNEKKQLQVVDVSGKTILQQTITGTTIIDASSLNEGVYNMSIINNEGVINKRLVIVR